MKKTTVRRAAVAGILAAGVAGASVLSGGVAQAVSAAPADHPTHPLLPPGIPVQHPTHPLLPPGIPVHPDAVSEDVTQAATVNAAASEPGVIIVKKRGHRYQPTLPYPPEGVLVPTSASEVSIQDLEPPANPTRPFPARPGPESVDATVNAVAVSNSGVSTQDEGVRPPISVPRQPVKKHPRYKARKPAHPALPPSHT